MNQGLYGMASGGGASVRKLSGVALSGIPSFSSSPASAWNAVGGGGLYLTTSAGVRTRLASVSGRGALRYFATQLQTPANDTQRVEVWIDGKKIIDISVALVTTNQQGINAVGFAVSAGVFAAVPDYIPFDSSCDLFVTSTTGGVNSAFTAYRIDLHE